MQRGLVAAHALGLADPVRRHEQPLAMHRPGGEERQVLRIERKAQRPRVGRESVVNLPITIGAPITSALPPMVSGRLCSEVRMNG
jgi:hypothetical protein